DPEEPRERDEADEMEAELHDHDEERVARAEEGLGEDHADSDDRGAGAHDLHGPERSRPDELAGGGDREDLPGKEGLEQANDAEDEEAEADAGPAEPLGLVAGALAERLGDERGRGGAKSKAG